MSLFKRIIGFSLIVFTSFAVLGCKEKEEEEE